jgi:hypothetical protein
MACPLCERALNSADVAALREELSLLRDAAALAEQDFDRTCDSLSAQLLQTIPSVLRSDLDTLRAVEPSSAFIAELTDQFLTRPDFINVLNRALSIAKNGILEIERSNLPVFAPTDEGPLDDNEATTERANNFFNQIIAVWRAGLLVRWWKDHVGAYRSAWTNLVGQRDVDKSYPPETLKGHLEALSAALSNATPFRRAAQAVREAMSQFAAWKRITVEQQSRERVCVALTPLKDLRKLVASTTQQTITTLSGGMQQRLAEIYLHGPLKFERASIEKQAVEVHGTVNSLRIDATLLANAAWLRAILWAFLFSLREQYLAQLGYNPLPLMVLDDPGATLDIEHRRKWASRLIKWADEPHTSRDCAQLMITTYESQFVRELEVEGFSGRTALVAPITPSIGKVAVIDGTAIQRAWQKLEQTPTSELAHQFISMVRVQAETLLKLMMRHEGVDISRMNLNSLTKNRL